VRGQVCGQQQGGVARPAGSAAAPAPAGDNPLQERLTRSTCITSSRSAVPTSAACPPGCSAQHSGSSHRRRATRQRRRAQSQTRTALSSDDTAMSSGWAAAAASPATRPGRQGAPSQRRQGPGGAGPSRSCGASRGTGVNGLAAGRRRHRPWCRQGSCPTVAPGHTSVSGGPWKTPPEPPSSVALAPLRAAAAGVPAAPPGSPTASPSLQPPLLLGAPPQSSVSRAAAGAPGSSAAAAPSPSSLSASSLTLSSSSRPRPAASASCSPPGDTDSAATGAPAGPKRSARATHSACPGLGMERARVQVGRE
jgi:hypothetical protein